MTEPRTRVECEEEGCDNDPEWVADGEGIVPTFLCDDHRNVYPDEVLEPIGSDMK